MFSSNERYILRRNQLAEVICQFRFPDILIISAEEPARFQEAIRSKFPQYHVRKESVPPKISGTPGNLQIENAPNITNYQFSSADGNWRINLTSNFISLSCSQYTRWEEFATMLDEPLAAFIRIYQPAYFSRIGLRYLNFISRQQLGLEERTYSELIAPAYLGVLSMNGLDDAQVASSSVDAQVKLDSDSMVKIHAGPGYVKQRGVTDNTQRFIFDQDLFMNGNIPIQASANTLNMLHAQAYPIFRNAILDPLWQAMDPEAI